MPAQVDLTAERHEVRETAKKNIYTGKTYNSLENISQFFAERGIKAGGPAYPPRKVSPPRAGGPSRRNRRPREKRARRWSIPSMAGAKLCGGRAKATTSS